MRPVVMPTGLRNYGESHPDGVWLGGCENCKPSPLAFAAFQESSKDPAMLFEHWNAQHPRLLELIAQRYKVSPEQVIITSGAYGGLETVALSGLHHAPRTMSLRLPDWPGFPHFLDLMRAQEASITVSDPPYILPVQQLIREMDTRGADCCLIANPSATQGFEYTPAEIELLIQSDSQRLVMVDEADSVLPERSTARLTQRYDNYIVIGGFSKLYGLSGQRIGWVIVPPSKAEEYREIISPCSATGTAVACALAAIQDEEFLAETKRRVARSLDLIRHACRHSPFHACGSDGCFVCFLYPKDPGGPDPYAYLGQRSIWLNPATTFGLPEGAGGRLNLSDPAKVSQAAEAILAY